MIRKQVSSKTAELNLLLNELDCEVAYYSKQTQMKTFLKFFLTLLLIHIVIQGYSISTLNDSVATLKIKANLYKNQTLYFDSPPPSNNRIPINLDSNGCGSISIPVKRKFFGVLYLAYKGPLSQFFIDKGYDLVFSTTKGRAFFSGRGAEINNYLHQSQVLLNQLNDSVNSIDDEIFGLNKFIRLSKSCDQKLKNLYKIYSEKYFPDKELDYLLRANMQASILFVKEDYISNIKQNEIDSLNIENKLGLRENNLLKDTLFIQCPSDDYGEYLTTVNDRYLLNAGCYKSHNIDSSINTIINTNKYSKQVKEFLLYDKLILSLALGGPIASLDSIAHKIYEKDFIHSEYEILFNNFRNEFNTLMPDNPAPPLQGISPDGKVYSLTDFKGKVIFVDIWATWCGPCVEALPHVQELQQQYKDNKDIVFIFLSNDSKEGDWKRYLFNHPEFKGIHLRARREEKKEDEQYKKLWKVSGIPRYMLIDKQGNIADAFVDRSSHVKMKEQIEKTLMK